MKRFALILGLLLAVSGPLPALADGSGGYDITTLAIPTGEHRTYDDGNGYTRPGAPSLWDGYAVADYSCD